MDVRESEFLNRYGERFSDFLLENQRKFGHTPENCQDPTHAVIRLESGVLICGPGGYYPRLEIGIVFLDTGPNSSYIEGKYVRSGRNPLY